MLIVLAAPLSANVLRTQVVMRNVIRIVISIVAGCFLMWPPAALVAALGIFATHRLRLALLVVAPIVLFNIDYVLYDLMRLPQSAFHGTRHALDEIELPMMSALLGWALGSLASTILNRRSAAVETAPP